MKTCQECNAPLTGRQKQFCSIACRNKPLGRAHGGRNRNAVKIVCENCGDIFKVPLSRAVKTNVRACSRKCLGAIQSIERTGRARPEMGIQTYRRARKDACERCGSERHLVVHHRDENRYNNDLSNLETLCKRCHQIHHACHRNLPKEPRPKMVRSPKTCEGCGKQFQPNSAKQRFCAQRCWMTNYNAAGGRYR